MGAAACGVSLMSKRCGLPRSAAAGAEAVSAEAEGARRMSHEMW